MFLILCLRTIVVFFNSGVLSIWSSFGECSKTCGKGVQIRSRECNGNGACEGNLFEIKECFVKTCPGKELDILNQIIVYIA